MKSGLQRGFRGFSLKPTRARGSRGWEGSVCSAQPIAPFEGSLRPTSGREEDGKVLGEGTKFEAGAAELPKTPTHPPLRTQEDS